MRTRKRASLHLESGVNDRLANWHSFGDDPYRWTSMGRELAIVRGSVEQAVFEQIWPVRRGLFRP